MTLKELTEGFFEKTQEEQTEVIRQVIEFYIQDMMEQGGNLITLRAHLIRMVEKTILAEEYEITEVLQQVVDGMTEILNITEKEMGGEQEDGN